MALADQIYVWRPFAKKDGMYQHHGIDAGDGSVIHYRKPSEIIEQTSWETFSRGNQVYVREYPEGFSFLPEVVVKRANSRLGENKYNYCLTIVSILRLGVRQELVKVSK